MSWQNQVDIHDANNEIIFSDSLLDGYKEYLRIRIQFLLKRFVKYPEFPGVHTGYNAITGEEFSDDRLLSYSWINGRGICVFSLFSQLFPEYQSDLHAYATHTIHAMETHYKINKGHFPFKANRSGKNANSSTHREQNAVSYSDLYACFGFLTYGFVFKDSSQIDFFNTLLHKSLAALNHGKFITEPDPTPDNRSMENPYSVTLDLLNECVKRFDKMEYLDISAKVVNQLLGVYYISKIGAFVEYSTPEGLPFMEDNGDYIVDPGHAIEFCSFALEFRRLAIQAGRHDCLCEKIMSICPQLLIWNLTWGWNQSNTGIYKSIDAKTHRPINNTMPWWTLPEAMLALLLAYEGTDIKDYLHSYRKVNNAYFKHFLNPKTSYGPYQTLDGITNKPIDYVPACEFQDPEFHAGKNILRCIEVIHRIRLCIPKISSPLITKDLWTLLNLTNHDKIFLHRSDYGGFEWDLFGVFGL